MPAHQLGVDVFQQQFLSMSVPQRRAFMAAQQQKRVTAYPYFSKVLFQAVRVGGPAASTYTIAQGTIVRAFSYAFQTGDAVAAGFPAAIIPTIADTNLTSPQQTIGGQSVWVEGLACQIVQGAPSAPAGVATTELFTDARFVAALDDSVSCELSLNGGEQSFKLGILSMIPGAGGLFGSGLDSLGEQALDGGRPNFHMAANGWPTNGNYKRIPEGLVWREQGAQDSQLNITMTAQRVTILRSGGLLDNTFGDEAAAAGIRGYTFPATLSACFMWHLKGTVIGPRSHAV